MPKACFMVNIYGSPKLHKNSKRVIGNIAECNDAMEWLGPSFCTFISLFTHIDGQQAHTTQGVFTQKPLGHGSWESWISHWLRVSWAPVLGLHEGSFGPQPITSSKNEKATWNATCQVWLMLAMIVRFFLDGSCK